MRLELTRRGDYAVRAMLALAQPGRERPTSVREIATLMDIPVAFLPQVMAALVRAGLVVSWTGRTGGYLLARRREAISLLEVIEAVEGDSRRTSCVLRGGPCGRDGYCSAHGVFRDAQAAMLDRLSGATLADVALPEEPDPAGRAEGPMVPMVPTVPNRR
ncbi:MAG TPA: Rrf2 family transcriptional regulator [Candidatus Limnocylindrales bacterium]|nr:Rrf2 family transcriptional regulator [Candidatus Limnocylindrales bacterium]